MRPLIHPRLLVAFVAALASIALTISLGSWQLHRAAEKSAEQARWDRAAQLAPQAASAARLAAIGAELPVRVRLEGRFLHEHEVWLDSRQMDGRAGLNLITPLRLTDGPVVLVNRGFAPRDAQDRRRLPAVERPPDAVTIEGMAVAQPPRVLRLGEDAPVGAGRPLVWQNFDFNVFERVSGLTVAHWIVQQSDGDDDGLLRRWPRLSAGVEKHHGYALQWYSLAALLALLTLIFGARTWRQATTHRPGVR